MKKLLIGCGVLVLLLLSGVGYIYYQMWPYVVAADEAKEGLVRLEDRFPFDAEAQSLLDAERFATSLEIRIRIGRELADSVSALQASAPTANFDDLGFFDKIGVFKDMAGSVVELVSSILPVIVGHLEQASMGTALRAACCSAPWPKASVAPR